MYFTARRLWVFFAFFISLGIGSFFVEFLGMSNDLGYSLGCVVGLVIWWLVASLLSGTMQSQKEERKYIEAIERIKQNQDDWNQNSQVDSLSIASNTNPSKVKKCPYCAEIIKAEAIVCRYCGRDLPEFKLPKPASPSKKVNQSRRFHPIPQPNSERIDELVNELGKQEAYRRKEALQELGNIEFPPQNSQKALVIQHIEKLASSDPNPDVKTAAALALLALQSKS